jgi:hypothetical protein
LMLRSATRATFRRLLTELVAQSEDVIVDARLRVSLRQNQGLVFVPRPPETAPNPCGSPVAPV